MPSIRHIFRALWISLTLCAAAQAEPAPTAPLSFTIERQSLQDALTQFGRQTGYQLLFLADVTADVMAPEVIGKFTPQTVLEKLLANSGLRYQFVNDRTITIRSAVAEGSKKTSADISQVADFRLVQAENPENMQKIEPAPSQGEGQDEDGKEVGLNGKEDEEDPERSGIPEILVTGSKLGTLNMDIRRTEDDIQPYIVFDREKIERSSAANLEEFFKNELTVGTSVQTAGQIEAIGNRSSVNLRGLGTDETLVLIDGRRVAGFNLDGTPQQPDINGIPLAAIERIEVLPTTASGVFGGGATGGVVNIVLRRNYTGFEAQATYSNSFASDMTTHRLDMNGGFNLEDGRTNILIAGSYSDANPLLVEERDFVQRGRQHILSTNPTFYLDAFNPPLGATPNIRSSNRTNLILDNGTPLNASVTHVPRDYAGLATDDGTALVENAGQYNLDLAPTAQNAGGGRSGLLSAPEMRSIMMTVRREFTTNVQAFVELQTSESTTEFSANYANLAVDIPGDAPNNPFQQSIRVTVPSVGMDEAILSESEDHRMVAGVITRLPHEWQAVLDFTWNRSRSSYQRPRRLSEETRAAIASGQLDVLRDVNRYPVTWVPQTGDFQSPGQMELRNTALHLAGPLPWSVPGGQVVLSSLVEHREEQLDDVISSCVPCGGSTLFPSRSQRVNSVYVEARLPFVSALNRRTALEQLEFQIAARRDEYTVNGANFISLAAPAPIERFTNRNSSIDPTIGARYQPMPDITLRASYGTGYLPPSMNQLAPDPSFPVGFDFLTDPLRGNESLGEVEFVQGGNPNLRPEESESWSLGLVFTPRTLPRLRFAVDWSHIEKIDNIAVPFGFTQRDLDTLIRFFPERIERAEPSDNFAAGRIVGLDNTRINIAVNRVEAVDLSVDYELDTANAGTLSISADATRLISRETQATPSAPTVENAGVMLISESGLDGGLKWRANGSMSWVYRGWTLGWRTRFFHSYFFDPMHTVNPSQGGASVPKQLYHDLYGAYRFDSDPLSAFSLLSNVDIRFGVNNVLDREPPIDVVYGEPRMYSSLGDPRLANYYITIRKSFER